MEDSRNIIKAIDALTLKAGGEVVDSKNITEAIDHLKAVFNQKAIGIDDTLTQEGLAADAKTVGDKVDELDNKVKLGSPVHHMQMFGNNANTYTILRYCFTESESQYIQLAIGAQSGRLQIYKKEENNTEKLIGGITVNTIVTSDSNGTTSITIPNGYVGKLITFSNNENECGEWLILATDTGIVSSKNIIPASGVTLSNSTNTLTISGSVTIYFENIQGLAFKS